MTTSRRGSVLRAAYKALFLVLWGLILIQGLLTDHPKDLLSWAQITFSAVVIVVLALSIFGPQVVRKKIADTLDAPGRGWFMVLYIIGLMMFLASSVSAISGQSADNSLTLSLFGTGLAVIGLALITVDTFLRPRQSK